MNEQLKIRGNKVLQKILSSVMIHLLHEIRSTNCDSTAIMREAQLLLEKEDPSEQKQYCLQLWGDIELMVWCLCTSPRLWVCMLQDQKIYALESNCIDLHVFTSKIYRLILSQGVRYCPCMYQLCNVVSEQVFILLQEISVQLSDCFEHCCKIIISQTKQAQLLLKDSNIVNFYLLYKLLLELSARCSEKVTVELQTSLFRHVQLASIESFTKYILEKHQILKMQYNREHSEKDSQTLILTRIKNSRNVIWRQAIREDGQAGIIVQIQQGQNYLLRLDESGEVNLVNCNSMNKKWKVSQAAQNNYEIRNIIENKKTIAEKLRNSPTQLKQLTMMDFTGTVGGTLGQCLARIKEYDSMGSFALDLSKKTIISGSFTYVAANIPLLGIIFATGGFTYSFYNIFSHKGVNGKRKIKDLGSLTLKTASSFGSGLLGATIGQTLIPVPFLGAFVGGLVGGFVGQFGSRKLFHQIQGMWFKNLISMLQSKMQAKGYWQVNKQVLDVIEVTRNHFYSTIPPSLEGRLGADKHWFSMIGFTLVSFNQSKKRAKFVDGKTSELNRKPRDSVEAELIIEDIEELQYEPSESLLAIMGYFQRQNLLFLPCFSQLQSFVSQLFVRLK